MDTSWLLILSSYGWNIPTWLYALDFSHMRVSKNHHFVLSKSVKHESSTCFEPAKSPCDWGRTWTYHSPWWRAYKPPWLSQWKLGDSRPWHPISSTRRLANTRPCHPHLRNGNQTHSGDLHRVTDRTVCTKILPPLPQQYFHIFLLHLSTKDLPASIAIWVAFFLLYRALYTGSMPAQMPPFS